MPGFRQLVELHVAHQADRDAARQQEQLRAEIVALDLQLASARGVLAGAEEAMNGFLADKRTADAELQRLEQQRSKFKSQLMDAKTNEVYKTLLHEIETATLAISSRETVVLELMEAIDSAKETAAYAKSELFASEKIVAAEAGRLEERIKLLQDRRAEEQAKAASLEPEVPADLLARYQRVAGKRGGKGMSRVEATVTMDRERVEAAQCEECNVAVRPQVMVDLIALEDLYECPGCSRILYREENRRLDTPASEVAPAASGPGTAEA